jgi:hypothetical protein
LVQSISDPPYPSLQNSKARPAAATLRRFYFLDICINNVILKMLCSPL